MKIRKVISVFVLMFFVSGMFLAPEVRCAGDYLTSGEFSDDRLYKGIVTNDERGIS